MNKKHIFFVILSSLIIGGIGGWLFIRFVVPAVNTVPFLVKYNLAPTGSPLVINKREEIRVNEGSDSIAAIQKAKPWMVGVAVGTDSVHATLKGSGIVLTSDGLIATSKRIILKTGAIYVTFSDGSVSAATIKAYDTATDLAFLKVDRNNLGTSPLGYSKDLQLGQRIIVLTSTLAEFRPLNKVSYLSAEVKTSAGRILSADQVSQTFKVDDLGDIVDGSMVISLDGNVQGIYSANDVVTGDAIRSALNSYFANGKILRPTFGFSYAMVSKTAANLNGLSLGAQVKKITAGSPAAKAGLLEGDVITSVNGTEINLDNSLEDQLLKFKPQDVVSFVISRNKEQKNISMTLGANQ